ncbi:shikimate dehydrogenase [Rhizobium halophytocola]|uniref:Shikimate dehydrogenase (NADP(+)) n=2 Tax=Rhizobium halophytocola TaxID=735519 RepID=A0ABS4E1Q2_9HYPH|nr:shikimate dehydrogenase [Rhizobium halophytocola]
MKAFVCGFPARHSRSPLIHNHWIAQYGLPARYDIAEVSPAEFPAFLASVRDGSAGYVGGNITIPHKEAAARLADQVDDLVGEIGAANTLWMEEGRLCATNSDGIGFLGSLDEGAPGWDRISTAVVLGAGGACRSILQALKSRGIGEIHVVNRTQARARELADRFGANIHAHGLDALDEVATGAGLFVNTTSLGMHGEAIPAMPFERMRDDAVVTDAVYIPLETPFLREAARHGLKTVDGLGMLLHQAGCGFEKWFGKEPAVTTELRQLIIDDMEARA